MNSYCRFVNNGRVIAAAGVHKQSANGRTFKVVPKFVWACRQPRRGWWDAAPPPERQASRRIGLACSSGTPGWQQASGWVSDSVQILSRQLAQNRLFPDAASLNSAAQKKSTVPDFHDKGT